MNFTDPVFLIFYGFVAGVLVGYLSASTNKAAAIKLSADLAIAEGRRKNR